MRFCNRLTATMMSFLFTFLAFDGLRVNASGEEENIREMTPVITPPLENNSPVRSDSPRVGLTWPEKSLLWAQQVDSIIRTCRLDSIAFDIDRNILNNGVPGCVIGEITLKSKIHGREIAVSFSPDVRMGSYCVDMPFHIELPANCHDLLGDGYSELWATSDRKEYFMYKDKTVDEKVEYLKSFYDEYDFDGEGMYIYGYRCAAMFDMVQQIQNNLKAADKRYGESVEYLLKELNEVLDRIWFNFKIKQYNCELAKQGCMKRREAEERTAQFFMCILQRRLELFLLKEISAQFDDDGIFYGLIYKYGDVDYSHIFDYIIDYARLFCQRYLYM